MYLVDTNVLSELRKGRHADSWAARIDPANLYLSVITLLEVKTGQLQVARRDAAQGALLERWVEEYVLTAFDGRILPIDTTIAQRCATLHVPDPRGQRDALIAATALVRGFTVVTRNVKHFMPMMVPMVNPWDEADGR